MLNDLEKRIIDISFKNKSSHIGSCLNVVNYLDSIYSVKGENDTIVLDNSHAALALWVVLEKYGKCNAEDMAQKYGTHAEKDTEHGVYVSGGSLGQALTVGVGMAIADPNSNVYIVTSDGACAEGCIWEALRIAGELRLENLRVSVIANGFGGYGEVDTETLDTRLNYFYPTLVVKTNLFKYPDWLQGLDGHYVTMSEEQYKDITND